MFKAVMSDLNPRHLSFGDVDEKQSVSVQIWKETPGGQGKFVDEQSEVPVRRTGDFKLAKLALFDESFGAPPADKSAIVTLPIFKTIAILAALTAIAAGITFVATANPLSATAGMVAKFAAIGFGASAALTLVSSMVKNYRHYRYYGKE